MEGLKLLLEFCWFACVYKQAGWILSGTQLPTPTGSSRFDSDQLTWPVEFAEEACRASPVSL